jgi:hypothetical protein
MAVIMDSRENGMSLRYGAVDPGIADTAEYQGRRSQISGIGSTSPATPGAITSPGWEPDVTVRGPGRACVSGSAIGDGAAPGACGILPAVGWNFDGGRRGIVRAKGERCDGRCVPGTRLVDGE